MEAVDNRPILYDYAGHKIDISKPIRLPEVNLVNTAEFCRAGQFFDKHGVYTKLNPKHDKREYKEFWDEEENRRKNGYTVGGVHITGDHYSYLNYRRIKRTKEDEKELKARGALERTGKSMGYSAYKGEFFPAFWDGDFQYFHTREIARRLGKNIVVGKARRKGYSYKNSTIVGNVYDLIPKSTCVIGAYLNDYLFPDGTMTMSLSYLDFINIHTDWNKRRLHSTTDFIESGFQYPNDPTKHGFRSKILTVSFKDKPGAARGKDAVLILLEEAGKFPNLKASYDATFDSTKDGIWTTGQIIIFGTGGNDATNWEDFEELFYEPEANNIITFENIWDDEEANSVCSFFHPDYRNLVGFIDDNGNSLIKDATEYEKNKQSQLAHKSSDPNAVDNRAMEHPNKPMEAFKRSANSILPITAINNRIKKIKHDPDIKYLSRNGVLVRKDGKVMLKTNEELKADGEVFHQPIIEFPLKDTKDLTGCVVEWHSPFLLSTGKTPKRMYRIWHDPYAHDKNEKDIKLKDSLGVAYVFEMPNKYTTYKGMRLVASYIGRPAKVEDYNDQLFLLAERYGAKIFYENDRGDVKGYAQRKKLLHYLEDEPEMLFDKENSKKTGRGFGMHINDTRKGMGIIYLRDWLNEVIFKDEETGIRYTVLDYINDLGLLEEMRKWKLKGNYDRVSALIVGMYDFKEELTVEIPYTDPNAPVKNRIFNRTLFG